MKSSPLVLCALCGPLWPALASAQICRGTADVWGGSTAYGGGSVAFVESQTTLAGTVAGGSDGYFVSGEVGAAFFDSPIDSTLFQSRFVGAAQISDGSRRVVVCPGAVGSYAHGDILGNTLSQWSVGGGAAVGAVAIDGSVVQVIPHFGFTIERIRSELGDLASRSDTATFGEVGVGFAFHRRFSIVPSVVFAFTEVFGEKPDVVYVIAFSVHR